MTAHFPACNNQFFDLLGAHVTFGAHVFAHDIDHAGQPVFLHDGEGCLVDADVAIVEGDDHRARGQVSAFIDRLHQGFSGYDGVFPIVQQFHLLFELFGRDVILAVEGRYVNAVVE